MLQDSGLIFNRLALSYTDGVVCKCTDTQQATAGGLFLVSTLGVEAPQKTSRPPSQSFMVSSLTGSSATIRTVAPLPPRIMDNPIIDHSQSERKELETSQFPLSLQFSMPAFDGEGDAEAEAATAKEATAAKQAEDDAAAEAARLKKEEDDKKPPKGSAEERVQTALAGRKTAEEATAKLQEELDTKNQADKDAEEARLKKNGEFETLAETSKAEAATAKEAQATTQAELDEANKYAKDVVVAELEGIEDEEKREIVKKQLEGKSDMAQLRALPDLLKLAGIQSAEVKKKAGGNGVLNNDGTPSDATYDKKIERLTELRDKSAKSAQGGEKLIPSERAEMLRLGTELSKEKKKKDDEAKKKKQAEEDDEITVL